ncbi:MAG: Ig-like domain-containing protein [Dysgonamonadaceae bacterium]|nr:Ig-like domain-containing protein [Dysgonamonadaceae bacterium]
MDLRSTDKGLKLPAVWLEDVTEFELSGNADNAEGMTVYNTNDNTKGGRGRGIYIWNGTWIYSGGAPKAETPVSKIVITSDGNLNTVTAGGILQLTDSILPANASNKNVTWSVLWSGSLTAGKATVDNKGLVTSLKPGNVTVRASAIDGSQVYRDFTLSVLPTTMVTGLSIYSETGADSVAAGRTLQLVAEITPDEASRAIKWEVISGKTYLTVGGATGVVTGTAVGTATVQATTLDGSNDTATIDIRVTVPILIPGTQTRTMGANSYYTYKYGDTEWMLEVSLEGTATYTTLFGEPDGIPYNYYTYAQALNACINAEGWYLPTLAQGTALADYLNNYATVDEKNMMVLSARGGYYDGTWIRSDGFSRLQNLYLFRWSGTPHAYYFGADYCFAVKCVYMGE